MVGSDFSKSGLFYPVKLAINISRDKAHAVNSSVNLLILRLIVKGYRCSGLSTTIIKINISVFEHSVPEYVQ